MTNTLIIDLLNQTDQLVVGFVLNAYAALVSALAEPLTLAITLSIAILGISISQGWVKLSGGFLNKYVLGLGFVYVFATSWPVFDKYIYQGLTNGPPEIANALINALHVPFHGNSVNEALQYAFDDVLKIDHKIWDLGGIEPRIFAAFFFIVGIIVCGLALLEFMMAKICLGILLALAPFFIPMYIFKPTQRLFDGWMGYMVGFSLVPIFVTVSLIFVLSFLNNDMANILANGSVALNTTAIAGFFLISVVSVGLLWEAGKMAKSIGGAVNSGDGISAVMAGIGAAAGAYAGAKTMKSKAGTVKKYLGKLGKIGGHESTTRF